MVRGAEKQDVFRFQIFYHLVAHTPVRHIDDGIGPYFVNERHESCH